MMDLKRKVVDEEGSLICLSRVQTIKWLRVWSGDFI